jgi:hypothetical protein
MAKQLSCQHCHVRIEETEERLQLACGGADDGISVHAMHTNCGWSALTPGGEIFCGTCRKSCSPSACTLYKQSGRGGHLVASAIAGGPPQAAVAGFAHRAASSADAAAVDSDARATASRQLRWRRGMPRGGTRTWPGARRRGKRSATLTEKPTNYS